MKLLPATVAIVIALIGLSPVSAQNPSETEGGQARGAKQGRGPGFGRGFGRGGPFQGGRGRGGMRGPDKRHEADHQVFEFLLQNHDKITRTVKELPNGVETLTESEDAEVASHIKEHAEWMEYRIKKTNPIRMRDPLFAELFRHTDKINMTRKDTEKGVRVIETSDDPYVAKLIQAHATVVSKFVERGFAEAMKNHAVPGDAPNDPMNAASPVIEGHGKVVRLPSAAQQPRPGTKLLVDITRGSGPGELNPAIEKAAKYVNLYAAGGARPADGTFALVFHGDATLAVLNSDAYTAEFGTKANPNVALLRSLHEAGVEMYVCGQTLISKGKRPEDVLVFVDTAVSALTAVVNLQADGFAYVPQLE